MPKYIIAADQGTTSSRAILFDDQQNLIDLAQREFTQYFPKEGWVEHDPMEIYSSQLGVVHEVVAKSGVDIHDIAAIGITNQRETVVVWERATGRPIHNAIVWQCRRTADICEDLARRGMTEYIKQTTGLVVDAYFSGTKIKWILDHVDGARERAQRGELLCGTVDSWLIYKLTNGAVHITDYTNASRTMLFDIRNLCWDETLCDALDIPMCMLPEVKPSSGICGYYNHGGVEIPIAGIAGDQQAALFGQACFEKGEVKNTYGTGCFILMHTGEELCYSDKGLITTIAASTAGQPTQYALEGSVFSGGSVVQWLRDELGLLQDAADSEYFATKVFDSAGVYLVPAFTGLGAPFWDMHARGTLVGLTRGANRNHIIRAALESIAYQSNAVIQVMEQDAGLLKELRVDGGASANGFLMRFQADITGITIVRPKIRETTALGAAYLAGLAVGVWKNLDAIRQTRSVDAVFEPTMSRAERETRCAAFNHAVERAKNWTNQ